MGGRAQPRALAKERTSGVGGILFAHGAGAGPDSDWMRAWARRLGTVAPVQTLAYPYMRAGRKAPDRLPKLVEAHREALREARSAFGDGVVLAGKSMGSRVGCHLALEESVRALVCFGFPLKAPGGALRDEVLLALRTPILFVQGTRDPLAPVDDFERVYRRMRAPRAVHWVDGGNHSLE
ncbi:MAG: alpha/beta family hydrolase, partial [Polyangiales bacterium]